MACTNVRDENGLTEEEYLKKYKPGKYERPSVTVDMLLFGMDEHYDSLKLLLIRRKIIRLLINGLFRVDSLI